MDVFNFLLLLRLHATGSVVQKLRKSAIGPSWLCGTCSASQAAMDLHSFDALPKGYERALTPPWGTTGLARRRAKRQVGGSIPSGSKSEFFPVLRAK